MPSIYNAECRTDMAMWCNVCMKARPVWQLGENHYCAWCRWRVDHTATAPEQLPEYALQRRVTDAGKVTANR